MNNLDTWPKEMYFQSTTDDCIKLPSFTELALEDLTFCTKQINKNDVKYIRADKVKEREDKLLNALKNARGDIIDWAAYASEYFREKYRLDDSIEQYDATIAQFEELK